MFFLRLFCFLIFFISENAIAQNNKKPFSKSEDINFTSDNLQVNDSTNVMTATGNVVITSDARKITADKVEYNQTTDKAIAIGNVLLTEKDGSIYESDKVVQHWGTNTFKNEFGYAGGGIDANMDYRKLGEAWSTPRIIRIKHNNKEYSILNFDDILGIVE